MRPHDLSGGVQAHDWANADLLAGEETEKQEDLPAHPSSHLLIERMLMWDGFDHEGEVFHCPRCSGGSQT
jgi:hypothetical protein